MPSADLYLKAPSGHIIGFTLPLHWTIENQLRDGNLLRVAADGSPYEEEPAAAPETPESGGSAPAAAGDGPGGGSCAAAPARPRLNASKAAWARHAAALGLVTAEEADGLPRAALIELTTPPEMQPADPEV